MSRRSISALRRRLSLVLLSDSLEVVSELSVRTMLKHHQGRYMAQFAGYMADGCGVMARAYVKRRTTDANAARPRCSHPALRQGTGSCAVYGRGFWCKLSDAPRQPLLSPPYAILRFPIVPSRHMVMPAAWAGARPPMAVCGRTKL